MKSSRLLPLVLAGCCFLPCKPALAQGAAPAYVYPKQFSADEVLTTKDGGTMTLKTYMDNGKIRNEVNANGTQMVSIIRPDQQKMYQAMVAQKMMMVVPLDSAKLKQILPPGSGGDEKVVTVGPDTVEGVAAIKYKMTPRDGKVVFLWVDAARQVPLKLATEDGTVTILWKNFQVGPQDAALFEPPSGYQVMNMPTAPPPGSGQ